MRIDKTVKGEKIPYYVDFLPNTMKASVRCSMTEEKIICDISKNFKYIVLPEDYETPYALNTGKVKIDKLTLSFSQQMTAMEYNKDFAKENSKPIFLVKYRLGINGFDYGIVEINVIETDKLYIGEGININKGKLLNINTNNDENHKSMIYYTYCKEGDQQKALDMLKTHIVGKAKKYKQEIDLIISHI